MNPKDYRPRDFQWSQRDVRWGWKHLGNSPFTVAGYGCAATAVNYVINRAWQNMKIPKLSRPGDLVDWGNKHCKFTSGGAIYWNIADGYTNGEVVNTWNKDEADYTLMEVYWGQLRHWVVRLGGEGANLCLNPWTGHIEAFTRPEWRLTGRFQYYKRAG